jgi:nucleoside-diphosphate-sugar epimerase
MRAKVTGGAGFIGSNLAELLKGVGNEVLMIDNWHRAAPICRG